LSRGACETAPSQPQDHILGHPSVLLAEKLEHVIAGVAEGPVHAHKGHLRESSDKRMELRVVGVAFEAARGIESVGGRPEEGALVYHALVLGQYLGVPAPQQINRRVT